MITRVRVEATAKTKQEVMGDLAEFVQSVDGEGWQDDNWVHAENAVIPALQTTKDGWWGCVTMRRDYAT